MSQSPGRRRWGVAITAGIGAGAAVLSFDHALTVARSLGTEGRLAYVVPLLPDGLVVLSSLALWDAHESSQRRPRSAIFGLVLGVLVTITLNVVAGHAWGRLLNALAPVALLVAVAVLEGAFRDRSVAGYSVAAFSQDQPAEPVTADDALSLLIASSSRRVLADRLGVTPYRVEKWAKQLAEPAGAGLNGDGHA